MENESTVPGFPGSIDSSQDLGVSVLEVCRSIRLGQNCRCAGDLSKFLGATTVNAKA